jgi:hypothetical protein
MDFHLIPVFRKLLSSVVLELKSYDVSWVFYFYGKASGIGYELPSLRSVCSCKRYPKIFGWSVCGADVTRVKLVVAATNHEPVQITNSGLYGLSKSYRETSVWMCVSTSPVIHCVVGADAFETSLSVVAGVSTDLWGEWYRLLPI